MRDKNILNDKEIQSLFEKDNDCEAYKLIEKKYGEKKFKYGEARNILLKVIFSHTNLSNVKNFNCLNYKVCEEAISLTRNLLKSKNK